MNTAVKNILRIVIELAIIFSAAYFFSIEAGKLYGWFAGIFHGMWVVPNYVISLVMDGHLVRATSYTTAYFNIWWIFFVITAFYYVSLIFRMVLIFK